MKTYLTSLLLQVFGYDSSTRTDSLKFTLCGIIGILGAALRIAGVQEGLWLIGGAFFFAFQFLYEAYWRLRKENEELKRKNAKLKQY
jgi:hypothetical protein